MSTGDKMNSTDSLEIASARLWECRRVTRLMTHCPLRIYEYQRRLGPARVELRKRYIKRFVDSLVCLQDQRFPTEGIKIFDAKKRRTSLREVYKAPKGPKNNFLKDSKRFFWEVIKELILRQRGRGEQVRGRS